MRMPCWTLFEGVEGPRMNEIIKGLGTSESPLAADVLAQDSRKVPQCLIDEGNYLPRTTTVPQKTYYDRDYAALELEHVWKKCWQFSSPDQDRIH